MNAKIRGLFQHEPILAAGTDVAPQLWVQRILRLIAGKEAVTRVRVRTPPKQWNYALTYLLNGERVATIPKGDALIVECRVRVSRGELGIGIGSIGDSNYVSHERILSPQLGIQQVRLWVGQAVEAGSLIFRSVAPDGVETEFELASVAGEIMRSGSAVPAPWLNSSTIPLTDLARALAWARTVWDDPFRHSEQAVASGSIDIIDSDQLESILGPKAKLNIPEEAKTKPLSDWKMEADDAPILRAVWRALAPARHFEFGTWEGFGTALVASVTDAEIWTINLAEGESGPDGKTLYGATDSGSFVGRLYRQAGYANRVHQLLSDSRALDTSCFEARQMDTVLIDGGHTPEVVASDTKKALRMLRPGGTCVWHDFCPDPEALRHNLAPLGVVQAIVENFATWGSSFERVFWVRKSWILVGLGHRT
ncbi:class I SAM-dependent methyltransferase [Reyranella sp.]|uniref:class I SAM-dependent methyltransferase n=1 Tax=Reyranella sp. TaxID=1929291 RepID=UPI003BAB387D